MKSKYLLQKCDGGCRKFGNFEPVLCYLLQAAPVLCFIGRKQKKREKNLCLVLLVTRKHKKKMKCPFFLVSKKKKEKVKCLVFLVSRRK